MPFPNLAAAFVGEDDAVNRAPFEELDVL